MPLDDSAIADLKSALVAARQKKFNFALCLGKTPAATVFMVHRVKKSSELMTKAKKLGETVKLAHGTLKVEGKTVHLDCVKAPAKGTAKAVRAFLSKVLGLKWAVVIRDESGETTHESAQDGPEANEASAQAGAEVEGAVANAPVVDKAQKAWEELVARLKGVVAKAASSGLMDPSKLRAAWASAFEMAEQGDYRKALQIGQRIEAALRKGKAQTGQKQWQKAVEKLTPLIEEARKNKADQVPFINETWAFCEYRAKQGDFDAALKFVPKLIKALQGAVTEAKDPSKEIHDVDKKRRELEQLYEIHAVDLKIVSAYAAETQRAEELLRLLAFQQAQFQKLLDAQQTTGPGDPDKPYADTKAVLKNIGETIGDLKAEKAAIDKAAALHEQVLADLAPLEADLKTARTIYPVNGLLEDEVQQFELCNRAFAKAMRDHNFAVARSFLDDLKAATARLLARKPEFDATLAAEREAEKKFEAYQSALKDANSVRNSLPAVAALRAKIGKVHKKLSAARSARNWSEVIRLADQCLPLAQDVVKLKGAADAQAGKITALNARRDAIRPTHRKLKARKATTPELRNLQMEVSEIADRFLDTFLNDYDLDKADSLMDELEDKLKNADALLALDDAAANTPQDQAKSDYESFLKNSLLYEVEDAKALAEKTRPGLDDDLRWLTALLDKMERFAKEDRFLLALDHAKTVETLAIAMLGKKKEAQKAVDACKARVDTKAIKAMKSRVNAVFALDKAVDDELKARQKRLSANWKKMADAHKSKKWFEASVSFDAVERDVEWLEAFKPTHDARKPERDAFLAEKDAEKDTLGKVAKLKECTPALREKLAAFGAEELALEKLQQRKDFKGARRVLKEVVAKAKDALTLQAEHDANVAAYDDVMKDYNAISKVRKKAKSLRPLTDELAKLRDAMDRVSAQFYAAFASFDYATAKALVPTLKEAAEAVIAAAETKVELIIPVKNLETGAEEMQAVKITAYENAQKEAKEAADAAREKITAAKPEVLRAKPASEKLKLLEGLRAEKKTMSKEDRALQRKLYEALEPDPAFEKQDEKRRAKLLSSIREDTELMAAKDDWSNQSIEQRLAAFERTLKAECDIYGMPAPTVRAFSEPLPGSTGYQLGETNEIWLNTHPSCFDDFSEALDTLLHENAHNYQTYLVTRLKEGLITEDDPEYNQAKIFAMNFDDQGYVEPKEDSKVYKSQPVEAHAWKTGGDTVRELMAPPPPTATEGVEQDG